ncbi:glycosyltransferase [Nonomuraea africana]|uniref:glycosyltransferase n=1 Tax=Nonomuraea africana TaxID=46171 RepID=UPI0033EE1873
MNMVSPVREAKPDQPFADLVFVDVVIPVLNEERALPGCVRTVHSFLTSYFSAGWRITIVDNGSTDGTWKLCQEFADTVPGIHAMRLGERGKGAAIKAAWTASPADVLVFMDVDLSTDLRGLLPLVAAVASGHCEIAIGTRLGHGARIRRGLKRELISRMYNGVLRVGFSARFSDATCGFKAAKAEVIRPVLDRVADTGWFFDTELLLVAQYNGVRIREVPVDWVEDADTRVNVWRTAAEDVRGLVRVSRAMATGAAWAEVPPIPELRPAHPDAALPVPRLETLRKVTLFALVGLASTVVHMLLYLTARQMAGPGLANLVALALTSLANTEANRRWTFNRPGGHRVVMHLRAALLFFLTYAVTTGSVGLALHEWPELPRLAEGGILLAVSIAMAILRFTLLDRWVFRSSGGRP